MPFLAPIIGAIAGAFGAIGGFIGSMGFIGKIVIGIGLNLISNAIAKKKRRKASQDKSLGGTNLNITYGGAQPREIGVGLFATAGQEIFACAFGEANKTFARVIQLSDFCIDSVSRILIEDEWCMLTGDNNSDRGYGITGKYAPYIRIKIYKGDIFQVADNYLVNMSGGQWTLNHRGDGLAYAIIYVDFDQEHMTSIPHMLFECRGRCYDPRFDSTVGGKGGQRWDNPDSWNYSDNPIVQAYNYSRGFYRGGELIMGKGMPPTDLPLSRWIEAMNICDELVGGQKRYRSGMLFQSGNGVQHRDNLEPIVNACAGAIVEKVDGDVPLVGITQAIIATLEWEDLIVDASHTYRPKRPRTELVNAVHGTYNDPNRSWEAVAYPAQSDAAALAADGERHATQIDFRAVFDGKQAARLARSGLRENRYQKRFDITVRPRWIVLEVGDWINFNHKIYGNGTYRVVSRMLAEHGAQGTRNVTLTLQEVGAGMYDETVSIPELPINLPAPAIVYQNFPDGFSILATQAIAQDNTRKIPVFDLTWLAPTDVTVTGIKIEYWQTSEPAAKLEQVVIGQKTAIRIVGVAPKTDYTFRATFLTEPVRTTLWSAEITVTSEKEDFDLNVDNILDDIGDYNRWTAENLRALQEQEKFLGLVGADAIAAGYATSRQIKRDLNASIGASRAEYRELITVAASETTALAAKVETLEVQVGDDLAATVNQIQTSINTVQGQVTANAQSLTHLQTQVDDFSSTLTIKAETSASPDTAWSRYGIMVKAGNSSEWSTGAFYIEAQQDASRVVFQTDQFIVTNGNLTAAPLTFANGVLRLNAADIGNVTAGNININNRFKVSSTGEVEIKTANSLQRLVITNSVIEVYDGNNQLRVQLGIW